MSRKKTHEEFIEQMIAKNPNIEILGKYVNNATKIKCRCRIDGNEWYVRPTGIIRGSGCPKCAILSRSLKRRKSHGVFIEEMKLINANIEILSSYTGDATHINCKCKVDGHVWSVVPSSLLQGSGCPKCGGSLKKTHEKFIDELNALNNNIEILSKYVNNATKVKCKCKIDGNVWYSIPTHLLQGSGCPKCNGGIKYTHKEFISKLFKVNKYIWVLSDYANNNAKVKCKCKVDGHVWYAKPNNLMNGTGCPRCNSSKGERVICKYLEANNIEYKTQYKIRECRHKLPLPFDFALFNKSKLIALIEYQGIQHYEPVDFAGKGEEWALMQFEINKNKDDIKKEYCKKNNIPLIEIPYWVKDIEEFMNEKLDEIVEVIHLTFNIN